MSLKARVALLALVALVELALLVGLGLHRPVSSESWLAIGLVTALIVTTFVVEPFFSKPSDTLATSLLTIGVWFSLRELATQNGWLFVLVAAGLSALAASSAATVVLNSSAARDGDSDLARRISAALHAVLSRATPSRVITSTALVCLPLVVAPDERLTAFCLVSCAAINTMRPDVASRVGGFFRRRPAGLTLGTLEALRSDGRHLVRAFRRAPPVLSACIAAPTDEGRIVGLVTRTLRANDQDLFEFVEMPGEIVPQYLAGGGPKRNEVASPPIGIDIERDDVVGIVAPHTTIGALRFQTFPSVTTLSAGDLVHTGVGDRTVVYQVTDATLVEERVSVLDRDTEIFVSARQIGFWSVEQERFDAHGWLPGINGIIRRRPSLPDNPARPDQITLGVLPGTDFSINVNFDDLITHHCAVLGVTGTGKSVFVRKFIRDLVTKGARCICVDLTGEYAKNFGQESKPLVNPETDEAIARCIAWLVKEEAEFANKRDRTGIAKCKAAITEHFRSSIKTFLDSDKKIAVMGVADLDSSSENVEYLRWFSTTLFGMAKSGEIDGRLALVLEEAHTIVPETAFLTSQDGRTKGLVNSIAQIALQGRKYGIGLIVVAQRTANVSKTILTQCNTIIAFRQFDRTSFDFLGSLLGEDSAKVLPTLRARHAYISGKALTSSNPLIFQVPEIND